MVTRKRRVARETRRHRSLSAGGVGCVGDPEAVGREVPVGLVVAGADEGPGLPFSLQRDDFQIPERSGIELSIQQIAAIRRNVVGGLCRFRLEEGLRFRSPCGRGFPEIPRSASEAEKKMRRPSGETTGASCGTASRVNRMPRPMPVSKFHRSGGDCPSATDATAAKPFAESAKVKNFPPVRPSKALAGSIEPGQPCGFRAGAWRVHEQIVRDREGRCARCTKLSIREASATGSPGSPATSDHR